MAENGETKLKMLQKDSSDEEPDVHVCGKCKKMFTDLSQYISHKQSQICKQFQKQGAVSVPLQEPLQYDTAAKKTTLQLDVDKIGKPRTNIVSGVKILKSPLSRALPSGPLGPPARGDMDSISLLQENTPPPITVNIASEKASPQITRHFESDLHDEQSVMTEFIRSVRKKELSQEQTSDSVTDDDEEDQDENVADEPGHISGASPTVVILDGTEIESAQVEVKIIEEDSQSPEFGESIVEVGHDHGYSQPNTPTSTGENVLTPKKRKRKNSTPKTTRKRKTSNSNEKLTAKGHVESQEESQGEKDSILVHIPETQLVHISPARASTATAAPSSARRKQVPATSVFVPIYVTNPPKTYRCHRCNAVFKTLEERQEHTRLHKPLYKCNDCSRRFFSPEALQTHQNTDSHQYPCEQCDKVLPSVAKLERHKVVHVTDKNFVCDICERCYRTEQNLRSHKYTVHAAEKKHKCSYCGKAFARKDKLTRHEYIHTPNRPNFVCPFRAHTGCTRTFYREDKLKRHLFTHSKEKPYKCEQCGRGFARRDNLRDHTRTHTGVYTHMCHLCNKGFLAPNKLKKHLQSSHGVVVSEGNSLPTMTEPRAAVNSSEMELPSQVLTESPVRSPVFPKPRSEATENTDVVGVRADIAVGEGQATAEQEIDVGEESSKDVQEHNKLSGEENPDSSDGSASESEAQDSTEDVADNTNTMLSPEPVTVPTGRVHRNLNLPALNSSLPQPPPLLPSSRFQGQQTPELLAIPTELLSIVRGLNS